ncbi:hypothetical protein B0T17DRAFT_218431 [Bombardia bombarda]|uniref:CFEM domain-containing protein n=1 Tax=Bombardia bombarda TaxID=252184 RepID=A0AA39XAW8_9PEZI|nr:hypothetical protein B0T17DRAFT_218431 [Bombardia bombarda]
MKRFVFAAALAGPAIVAQVTNNLPPCGVSSALPSIISWNIHTSEETDIIQRKQICINNMIGQAAELGCQPVNGQPDAACLCGKPNFGYGIRDCSIQACAPSERSAVVDYGLAYCGNAAKAAAPKDGSQTTVPTPAAVSALVTQGVISAAKETGPETLIINSAVTASVDIVSTYTSGDSTITTTIPASVALIASGATLIASGVITSNATVRGLAANTTTTVTSTNPASDRTTTAESTTTSTRSTSSRASTSTSQGGGVPVMTMPVSNLVGLQMAVAAAAIFVV